MPLPGDVTTITVTGTYEDMQGTPLVGTVSFRPSVAPLTDSGDKIFFENAPVSVTLSGGGALSLVLPTTDQFSPTGWTWQVSENFQNSEIISRTYYVALPSSLGSTVDLTALAPLFPAPATYSYLPTSGGTLTGPEAISGAFSAGGALKVTNTASAPTNANVLLYAAAAGDGTVGIRVTGDAASRLLVDSNGKMSWGDGTDPRDVNLYRSAAGILKTDNSIQVATALGVGATPPAAGVSVIGNTSTGQLAYIEQDGSTDHCLTLNLVGTGGTANSALNAVSANSSFSCVEVTGVEKNRGTVKIAHKGYADGSDSSAAAVSIDLQTTSGGSTGTHAQGIFVTSTTDSIPGGNAITVSFNSQDWFVVKGNVGAGNGIVGIGVATGHIPAGMIEIAQKDTTTVGLYMTALASGADMVNLKDSGGNLRFQINNAGNTIMRATAFASTSLQIGSTSADLGGGAGVVSIKNATTSPTANPTGGIIVYANGGVPTYRDPAGSVVAMDGTAAVTPLAGDQNLLAWSYDPASAQNATAPVAGTVQLIRVILRKTATVTNVIVHITSAGSGLTGSQNFAGLYNSAGTLLSATADQTTAWASTGLQTIALTSQQVNLAAGTYYVALVANGTTPPSLARGAGLTGEANLLNAGLTSSTARFATGPVSQTSLPASITMASNTLAAVGLFAALS